MTSTEMGKQDWGEERLAARNRQKAMIRGVMFAGAAAFGAFAPRIVPPGPGAAETKLIMVLVYTILILFGGWLLWRRDDELARQRIVNAFAAMGLTCFALTLVVETAVPVMHLQYPAMIIWTASLIVGGVTLSLQRLKL